MQLSSSRKVVKDGSHTSLSFAHSTEDEMSLLDSQSSSKRGRFRAEGRAFNLFCERITVLSVGAYERAFPIALLSFIWFLPRSIDERESKPNKKMVEHLQSCSDKMINFAKRGLLVQNKQEETLSDSCLN